MFVCLRVDLDYVPWDTPDAEAFGHGEPAALLRLLDLARSMGLKLHCFASSRNLRAFPCSADAVLGDGHDLDWLCKHPEEERRYEEAAGLFRLLGHSIRGIAHRDRWPEGLEPAWLKGIEFLSSPPGLAPAGVRHFPLRTAADREAFREGLHARQWAETLREQIRAFDPKAGELTACLRPQVLARWDPKLGYVREVIEAALRTGLPLKTFRQALQEA